MGFVHLEDHKTIVGKQVKNNKNSFLLIRLLKFYYKRFVGKHLHVHDLKVYMVQYEVSKINRKIVDNLL